MANPNPASRESIDTRLSRVTSVRRHRLSRLVVSPLTGEVLLLSAISRLVLFGLVWISMRAFPRLALYRYQTPDTLLPGHPALDGWARWDAVHYLSIAAHGYPAGHDVAFFPAYPLLVRGLTRLFGLDLTTAHVAVVGIISANLCFLLAVPLLARLAADRFGGAAGRNAALLLCITPFGFFFSAAYTESLFLLLVLSAFTFADRGRWGWAGIAAGLASATRLAGLALLPSLLLLAIHRKANRRDRIMVAVLAPTGLLAYLVYCGWKLGDALAPFRAQQGWGGWDARLGHYAALFLTEPRAAIRADPRNISILLNVMMGLLVIACLYWVWRRLDPGLALFTTLIALQFGVSWISLGRYLLPAVGFYLAGGALLTRPGWSGWRRDVLIVSSSLALGLLAVLYGHGFWIV